MNKFHFIPEGFKGFYRNGFRSFASIVVLMSSLLLVGIFATLMFIINGSVSEIKDFNEIVVYMKLDADSDTVSQTKDAISQVKNVTNVTYISKAEALQEEKAKFGEEYAYIFDAYNEKTNPLPDTFKVEYNAVESIDAILYNIGQMAGVDRIKNRYDIARNIENFKNALKFGGSWLMVLLIAVSVFVISNTIKLSYHARETEITVMRYIGATKSYIVLPFIVEGALVGVFSGVIGYALQYYLYAVPLNELVVKFGSFLAVPPFETLNFYYLIIYFAAGILLGIVSSAFAIKPYMKA